MAGLSQEFLFRDVFNERVVAALAQRLAEAHPELDEKAFINRAARGFEELGLAERSQQITDSLAEFLPDDFAKAVEILCAALGPELPEPGKTDWDSFIVMPQCTYVSRYGRYGRDHWELSMNALHEMTRRFSAEGDLRTFIELDFPRAMAKLRQWARDPSPHVRRLVSEGTRPRLPLAGRIRRFVEDPTPVLELLELLQGDPSDYVRRSVANNLNDISKDNPEAALDVLERWNRSGSAETTGIVRHAARTLLKQGHPRALALFGYAIDPAVRVEMSLTTPHLRIGETLELDVVLTSTGTASQHLMIDYVVYFVKASGKRLPKVFKWTQRRLDPGQRVSLSRRQHLRPTSGRPIYPGRHAVSLQINGVEHPAQDFDVSGD